MQQSARNYAGSSASSTRLSRPPPCSLGSSVPTSQSIVLPAAPKSRKHRYSNYKIIIKGAGSEIGGGWHHVEFIFRCQHRGRHWRLRQPLLSFSLVGDTAAADSSVKSKSMSFSIFGLLIEPRLSWPLTSHAFLLERIPIVLWICTEKKRLHQPSSASRNMPVFVVIFRRLVW